MYKVYVQGTYAKPTGGDACVDLPYETSLVIPECSEVAILSNIQNRFILPHLKKEKEGLVRFVMTTEIVSYEKVDGSSGLEGKDIFKLSRQELELFACEYDENDISGAVGDLTRNRAKAAWYYLTKTGKLQESSLSLKNYLSTLEDYEQEPIIIEENSNSITKKDTSKKKLKLSDVIEDVKPKRRGRPPKAESGEFKKI